MAHPSQQHYCLSIKEKFPDKFHSVSVLDVGSMDINGNNRYLFENYEYTGIDIGNGRNVDLVMSGNVFKSNKDFDVIISTECFEHDKFWVATIFNTWMHLKQGGIYLFTCAADGRPEHGTSRADGWTSPFTNDYYMNLNESLVRDNLPLEKMFIEFEFKTNHNPCDLYFYGIKK
jgi:hypothetical protein